MEEMRRRFEAGDEFWAGAQLARTDELEEGGSLNWTTRKMTVIVRDLPDSRITERQLFEQAIITTNSARLIAIGEQLEGEGKDSLSIAIANYVVGKKLALDKRFLRSRYFLTGALYYLVSYCRAAGMSFDSLFAADTDTTPSSDA